MADLAFALDSSAPALPLGDIPADLLGAPIPLADGDDQGALPPSEAPGDTSVLDGLNDNQRAAVLTTTGPLLVLAGAGSGKTRVLVTRIVHLVKNCGVPPSAILGITFTRKAALEMRERLAQHLDPEHAEQITLTTFHALGVSILREYGALIGLGVKFGIADESDVATRLRGVLKAMGLPRNAEGERPRDVQARISRAKAAFAHLVAQDAASTDDLIRRYRAGDPAIWARIAGALDAPDLTRFQAQYAGYQAALVADNVVDYDDLIALPLLLFLQRPEIRHLCCEKWTHLFVDEYQDTDFAQDQLLRLLAGSRCNLCVVGDDDQAIYSWRNAKVENIRTFANRYPGCRVVTLNENYRSTPVILAAANASLAARPQPGRLPKTLWTRRTGGEPIRLLAAMTQEAEAYAVAQDIAAALSEGAIASYDDVMVLYRVNALARPLEEAFRRSGIPYRIVNGFALHERKDVRDMLAYLKAADNWHDLANFERAVTNPSRGVGPNTIEALASYARTRGLSPVEAALTVDGVHGIRPKQAHALKTFAELLLDVRRVGDEQGAAAALQHLLDATRLRQRLVEELAIAEGDDDDEAAHDYRRRLHDLDDFVLYVEEFCRAPHHAGRPRQGAATSTPVSIGQLLDALATLTADAEGPDRPHSHTPDVPVADGAVTLMSVHAAKGLEKPRVYVVGLEERVFPVSPRDGRSDDQQRADEELAEEARLFYVALTRAREHLILSTSRTRELQRNDPRPMVRSRFLAALPETIYREERVR